MDTLNAVGGTSKGKREITGVVERIGVLPGTDNASYAYRLKDQPATYMMAGSLLSGDEVMKSGMAIALTEPGDEVRFHCDVRTERVSSFENLSYPAISS